MLLRNSTHLPIQGLLSNNQNIEHKQNPWDMQEADDNIRIPFDPFLWKSPATSK